MSEQFSSQLPNRDAKLTAGGLLTDVWYNFFAFLASLKATPVVEIAVGLSSPYAYEATSMGSLHVEAGSATISSVVLQRGGVSLTCPTSGFVPVAAGDVVEVAWSGLGGVTPTLTFVPAPRT